MRFRSYKTQYGSLNFPSREAQRGRRRWQIAGLTLAGLLGAWGLVLFAEADEPPSPPHVEQIAPAPAPAAWIEINRPFQIYGLEAPALAKLSRSYEARRHQAGGGRQDILTFGSANADAAYVRMVLYRPGTEDVPKTAFFVDMALHAADAGLAVTHSPPPAALATRFGEAEAADLTLTTGEGRVLPCLGFRLAAKTLPWSLMGFACDRPKPMDRRALRCLFDRLDLNAAGDDRALAKFFADAELRRDPACAGTRLTPAAMRTTLLDEKDPRENDWMPPLRLRH